MEKRNYYRFREKSDHDARLCADDRLIIEALERVEEGATMKSNLYKKFHITKILD